MDETNNTTTEAPAGQIDNQTQQQVQNAEAVLRKNEELLAEVKKLRGLTKAFEGLDPEQARNAQAQLAKIEEERLSKKGEYDKLLEQKSKAYEERISKIETERDQILANLKRDRLTNVLTSKGVLPDRAKYLMYELESQVELVSDENGFSLKRKGGIGDAAEFDAMLDSLKSANPWAFASNATAGGGASGSNNGGNPAAKQMKRADFERLAPTEQMAFVKQRGVLID